MGQKLSGPVGPAGPKGDSGSVGWNDFSEAQKLDVVSKLKVYSEFKGPPGPPGPPGYDSEPGKTFLKENTLWCADGQICKFPANSKGFASAEDIIFNPKSKVSVTGNVEINGFLNTNGEASFKSWIKVGGWYLEDAYNGELRIHRGDKGNSMLVIKNDKVYTKRLGYDTPV